MTFQWKQENPLSFPKDFGEGFFRLPKYIVTFRTRDEPYIINYGDGKFVFFYRSITKVSPMTWSLFSQSSWPPFSPIRNKVNERGEKLFVRELFAIHFVCMHFVGKFCRGSRMARKDGKIQLTFIGNILYYL